MRLPPAMAPVELKNMAGDEASLVREISAFRTMNSFTSIFREKRGLFGSDKERVEWLRCVLHYVRMDTNKNHIPDWTPVVDGELSKVLLPNKDDIDGDGVGNLLDADPLDAKVGRYPKSAKGAVPPHLVIEGTAHDIQEKLYRNFEIIVIDHGDQHSAEILKEFHFLLSMAFPPGTARRLKSVRAIYAFASHDSQIDIAAYHRQIKALSIGGVATYGDGPLDLPTRIRVLGSLAHELGHAFIFDRMSARELRQVGERFGFWRPVLGVRQALSTVSAVSLLAKPFLTAHPLTPILRLGDRSSDESLAFIQTPLFSRLNLTSEYAATNLHEWFADAFAAHTLQTLGEKGYFSAESGGNWRVLLTRLPDRHDGYWTNYNNLSPSFRVWMKRRLHR